MKLSIITINFNDYKGLEKTIKSVINQTFKDFEYIVIDGASTDDSVNVIKKYADTITKWVSEPDTGIYNAMNKGTHLAQGEYCLYINSGDFLAADDVLEKAFSKNFTEDIVSCNLELFDKQKTYLQKPPTQISLFTFTNGSLPHPSTFIKRKLLEEIGGYKESYRIVSDWCFFLEAMIIRNCNYRTIDIVLSKFNCFGISSTNKQKRIDETNDYLTQKFPKIMVDYTPFEDEAVYNVMRWAHSHSILRNIIVFPFKVINRLLKLRNKLGVRGKVYFLK